MSEKAGIRERNKLKMQVGRDQINYDFLDKIH